MKSSISFASVLVFVILSTVLWPVPLSNAGGSTLLATTKTDTLADLALSPWPHFLHDLGRTSRSPYIGPDHPVLKWHYSHPTGLGAPVAIGPDGTVYASQDVEGKLYAIAPGGSLKWTFLIPHPTILFTPPALGPDGTIYIGDPSYSQGHLYALNPDGSQKWSHFTNGIRATPGFGADGTVYIASTSAVLYALDPVDGSEKWVYKGNRWAENYASPAIGNDSTIYIPSPHEWTLDAINPDGTNKWSRDTDVTGDHRYIPEDSPVIADDGTIYIRGASTPWGVGGWLHAFTPDGVLKWEYNLWTRYGSSPALGHDGTIYIVTWPTKLHALTPNGELKWTHEFTNSPQVEWAPIPVVDGNDTIYLPTPDGKLYAINPDGTEKWAYQVSTTGGVGQPIIDADGTLLVGGAGGLYAIGESNSPPDCSVAMPSVSKIWPPNHKFVPVEVAGVSDPDGNSISITINSIFQDEPVNGNGDGNTSPDGQGVGTATAQVQAERDGGGNGRVYHISFTADDGNGGSCSGEVLVGVPHDKKDTPIDDGPLYDSTVP